MITEEEYRKARAQIREAEAIVRQYEREKEQEKEQDPARIAERLQYLKDFNQKHPMAEIRDIIEITAVCLNNTSMCRNRYSKYLIVGGRFKVFSMGKSLGDSISCCCVSVENRRYYYFSSDNYDWKIVSKASE